MQKAEILNKIGEWLGAWDDHNLEGVMALMHEDTIFENWSGAIITGKNNLQRIWVPWFINHGNFRFFTEDIFVDEPEQKVLYRWRLEWPSQERYFKGKHEVRRGVDVLYFKDGKIIKKLTYSKTTFQIDSMPFLLSVQRPIEAE